jgi:hypothetical protein
MNIDDSIHSHEPSTTNPTYRMKHRYMEQPGIDTYYFVCKQLAVTFSSVVVVCQGETPFWEGPERGSQNGLDHRLTTRISCSRALIHNCRVADLSGLVE